MASGPYVRLPANGVQNVPYVVMPATGMNVGPIDSSKSMLRNLGITEMVLGGVSCFLCLVSIIIAAVSHDSYMYGMTFVSPGIWCGVFLFISGGLGVRLKTYPSLSLYHANLAMSICSAVMMGILLAMSSITAAVTYFSGILIAIHSLLAVLAFAAMVVCIVHSAYCCAGTCCRGKPDPSCPTHMSGQVQQFVQLSNGQFAPVQAQLAFQQNHPVAAIPGCNMPVTMMPAYNQTNAANNPGVPVAMPTNPATCGQVNAAPGTAVNSNTMPVTMAPPYPSQPGTAPPLGNMVPTAPDQQAVQPPPMHQKEGALPPQGSDPPSYSAHNY